jgi:hypothetical protein
MNYFKMKHHIISINNKIRFCLSSESTDELDRDLEYFLTRRKPHWSTPLYRSTDAAVDPKLFFIPYTCTTEKSEIIDEAKKFDLHYLTSYPSTTETSYLKFIFGNEPQAKYTYVEQKDRDKKAIRLSYEIEK